MQKVLMLMANGFEECEALLVTDILTRAGCEVTMASVTGERLLTSSHGVKVQVDLVAERADPNAYELLVLPGGMPGTLHLAKCRTVARLCRAFAQDPQKRLAAICAAPSVLAGLGLLEGKQATCHPSVEDKMTGATLTHAPVTVDGNITTGRGLGAGIPFALELARQLVSPEAADKIAQAICWPGEAG